MEMLQALAPIVSSHELEAAAGSDAWWMKYEFGIEHDPSALECEANVFRYRPFARCLIRANEATDATAIARMG